ncbi:MULTISPECIES: TolC family outer membrane protein [Pseudomonas]|uniref:TolC family outer membrane protein n=1 Tax=Pseudomonas TaxID=286 RepID=UPI00029AF511|nr:MULTISPECIES: TolC family outer membrane protein [Pseudomonas]MCP6699424.1 TolC family outer membrane protein [Pseudomonas donghuensis]PJY97831.1 channel protein TolC [Pseudomonas donghuensis]QHF29818.1 channel protein TolC [Pseudomonas sp. R32]UVL23116.1 TolC family outer membrane protein [Pseudomonas donghuensis]UVL28252.1 TolC family outer membrane protein [Pseudomonas donghuensis]
MLEQLSRIRASLIALLLLASSQQARADDLYQLYQKALAHDMKYAAAIEQQRASNEKEPQGRALLLPNLSLEGGAAWVDRDDSGASTRNRDNSNAYALVLIQPLLRWQNVIGHDQSKALVLAGEINLQAARQDLMLRVADAYFDLLLAEDLLSTSRQQVRTLQEQRSKAERFYQAGSGTESEVQRIQARYDLAYARQMAAHNAVQLHQETLAQLTGSVPAALARLDPQVRFQGPQPALIGTWAEQAQQHNLKVQAAQIKRLVAEKEIDKQQAGHLPTVDLVAAHGRFASVGGSLYDVTLPEEKYTQTVVGVQVSLPLYAGGGTTSRTREARALHGVALDEVEDARREAGLMARQAYLTLTSGISQYAALQQALRSSQTNLTSTTRAFEAGARISSDVLDAEQQVTQTEQQLAEQRYAIVLAQLRLLAASGSLGDAGLQEINALLSAGAQG